MRILLVSHNYLPAHTAGTEVYTAQLAAKLVARGHEVQVFTTEKEISAPHLSLRRRSHRGIAVHELVNNLFYDQFRETWDEPRIDRIFAGVLDEFSPDVVHVQHLLYLSIGCVEAARARSIPVVFTLHDYWLQCARFGQRVHADSSICHTIDAGRCGECLTSFKFRQGAFEERAAGALAGLRGATGIDLGRTAVRVARLLTKGEGSAPAEVDPREAERFAGFVRERESAIRARLIPAVARFLSPSRFLRERFVEWGLPPDRIQFLRTGIDLESFEARPRRKSARLRVAFIGTLAPHKGAHLLLEAWDRVDPNLRARATLELIGPGRYYPDYVRALRVRAAEVGASLRGALPREQVATELTGIDLLVVPSVWFENSPLVILEALATRTPLLVSDIGGMAELVEDGVHGYRFAVGDVEALREGLARLLSEPELLERVQAAPAPIKRVDDDAVQLEEVYFEALEGPRARPPGGTT